MRKSRLNRTQIIGKIKELEDDLRAPEPCRRYDLDPKTFYKLQAKYGRFCPVRPALVIFRRRLHQLTGRNARCAVGS